MSTPNEYAVVDGEGDKLIVIRSEEAVVLGIEPNVDDSFMMVSVLRDEECQRMAEVLAGDLLASGDASRTHENRWGAELEIRVGGDLVAIVLRHPAHPLGMAFGVELTLEQAGHVHEMMTK